MSSKPIYIIAKLALLLALIVSGVDGASAQVTVSPSSINFGSVAVNVVGLASRVTLTNNTTSPAILQSISFSKPQFQLSVGLADQTVPAGMAVQFAFIFLATQPGTYNGTISFNLKNMSPLVVQAKATAFVTTAVASLSANSVSFGTVAAGTTGTQTVTVTNTGGPDAVTVEAVNIYYQPFSAPRILTPVTLQPGQSYMIPISFSPMIAGSTTGSVTICFDVLPCEGVDLTGSGKKATGLAVTSYPAWPYMTPGFNFRTTLKANGGTQPYTWEILSGTKIAGLKLNTATGLISGTVSKSVAPGVYSTVVQVQDSSSPPLKATQTVSITVGSPTGANCNIVGVNVSGSQTAIVDLMDLATRTYLNYEGGLYPNGSNVDPNPHHSDGVAIAQGIVPLDKNGNPNSGGSIVMLSLGESATEQPFSEFTSETNADPMKNPSLVLINGAQGGATANLLASTSSLYWVQIMDYLLPQSNVTADQVEVAFIDDVNSSSKLFPYDAQDLQGNLESIAQNLLYFFPNIKMAFFSTLNYSGYSTGVDNVEPEPESYESAFAAKWAIEDQINGDPALNYNPANGPVTAPWIGWSFYHWGNGLLPRSDGITWSCQDLGSDGLHPANPWGHIKIAGYLLNWFKNSDLSTPWFVAPGK
ncbi:MAG TPA: choice-of-anchor D domain-containing protein [Terriglobia bacterium]|nr:choice-of-anchor D domain-containing protein [Terriglobia bacterium]